MRKKTCIIGCGRLGSSIALDAYARGDNVTVIDIDENSFDRLSDSFAGYTEVADATDAKSLEVLGIHDVTELIITTGNDNDNLFIAHLANKIYNVPNIYVRLNNPEECALIEETGIKAIYPFQLSFEAFSKLKKEGEK